MIPHLLDQCQFEYLLWWGTHYPTISQWIEFQCLQVEGHRTQTSGREGWNTGVPQSCATPLMGGGGKLCIWSVKCSAGTCPLHPAATGWHNHRNFQQNLTELFALLSFLSREPVAFIFVFKRDALSLSLSFFFPFKFYLTKLKTFWTFHKWNHKSSFSEIWPTQKNQLTPLSGSQLFNSGHMSLLIVGMMFEFP